MTGSVTAGELEDLIAKANQGDPAAQYDLGRRFADGNGVEKDLAAALAWYQKAAARGRVKAEVQLGSFHAHGFATPVNWEESIRWYRQAAGQGDTTAQHNLGLDYAHGHGVEKDPAEAARWFRLAADQGHARAQFNLGELYEAGRGVPQDLAEAHLLYTLAGQHPDQEHLFGAVKAAEVIASRERTSQQLSEADRAAAPQRVAASLARIAVHPRRFGSPGQTGKSRGWFVWQKWNPETWEADVTTDPPGETFHVRVLPWATTYRHLNYGARFDEILPGEKMNMFFDADENHRRGYVVHFQDEIGQMHGHGHFWKVLSAADDGHFTAQVFAGEKPLTERVQAFEVAADCVKWQDGKQVNDFRLQPGDQVYMTWVYDDERAVVRLLTDAASLPVLKEREAARLAQEVAAEGMSGQLESLTGAEAHLLLYSTYWSQGRQLRPGDPVQMTGTGPGYHPQGRRIRATVVSQKNRGQYGSGVNDVRLQLDDPADADLLREQFGSVLRLIPSAKP
ncbi:tetratricopeptide repeat protein [Lignipirellula cremea]|uniref:tetratricopeptide repeat protein n=1 Tax=Lignipirellula cremea TaxID=2528010 RepID=UPI0018D25DDD|nr:tetratricopeptide repeat protein [Lignipirellula cremea]